jgi:hypothetical protein
MDHVLHPHIETRKKSTEIEAKPRGFNDWLAIKITNIVGTMWCAYAFTALTLLSLPDAIKGGRGPLVAWVAQTFLQLVLLSIIMVGQKVDAAASDRQARQTYEDAEALLQISDDIHRLLRQNTSVTEQINKLMGYSRGGGQKTPISQGSRVDATASDVDSPSEVDSPTPLA